MAAGLRACPDAALDNNKRAKTKKLTTFIFLASFSTVFGSDLHGRRDFC
jgi:hypothetical protein